MTVFRILTGLAVAGLIAATAFDLRSRAKSWNSAGEYLLRRTRESLRAQGEGILGGLDAARRTAIVASFGLLLLLAMTGFLPVLLLGTHLSGLMLVIHVTAAPFFAVALSASALLWAHRLRFNELDWQAVEGFAGGESPRKEALLRLGVKAGFWIVLSLSLPLMLTIILGLFPLFGTEGETLLIRLHGYSALLLMITALSEFYAIIACGEHTTEQQMKEQKR